MKPMSNWQSGSFGGADFGSFGFNSGSDDNDIEGSYDTPEAEPVFESAPAPIIEPPKQKYLCTSGGDGAAPKTLTSSALTNAQDFASRLRNRLSPMHHN